MKSQHKIYLLACLGTILAVGLACAIQKICVGSKAPVIVFERAHHDAGIIQDPRDRTVAYAFAFQNLGPTDLKIEKIRSSCGCAIINTDCIEKTYGPGEEGMIYVQLTLGSVGARFSEIQVMSNARSSPDRLSIEGTFRPKAHVEVVPGRLTFSDVKSNSPASRSLTVEVLATRKKNIRVSRIGLKRNTVAVSVKDITSSTAKSSLGYYNTTIELEVTPRADTIGSFSDEISIELAPPIFRELHVPVDGEVTGNWKCTPDSALIVFPGTEAELPSRTLLIENKEVTPFRVRRVDNPLSEWLGVHTESLFDKGQLQVTLTGHQRTTRKRITGVITLLITSEQGEDERIEIPVTIVCYGVGASDFEAGD